VACALLEYEWLTGIPVIEASELNSIITLIGQHGNAWEGNEFAFWLQKARQQQLPVAPKMAGAVLDSNAGITETAHLWRSPGC
ncbi:hypothetical protein ABTK02_22025, partial [Acinetobacter baumannii]